MALSRPTLGARHRGLTEWLVQRATAVYLAGFGLFVLVRLGWAPPPDPVAWFGATGMRIAMVLFWWTVLAHAWVGLRSVYLDYLGPLWLRLIASGLTLLGLGVLALWVLFVGGGLA